MASGHDGIIGGRDAGPIDPIARVGPANVDGGTNLDRCAPVRTLLLALLLASVAGCANGSGPMTRGGDAGPRYDAGSLVCGAQGLACCGAGAPSALRRAALKSDHRQPSMRRSALACGGL